MKKISIIIPIYNVEDYLKKCLDSIVNQTYKNLEILCINDGSTDKSGKICDDYAKKDNRVRAIHQTNAGVTAARNAGMAASTGEYLTFIDSDDWIEPDMYQSLTDAITKTGADVAVCDYNLIYDDRIDYNYSNMKEETIDLTDGITDYFYKYCACYKPNNYLWTRLYKTELIKSYGVKFGNYKIADDTLFNFMLLPYIKKVTNISGAYYNYLQRTNSNVYTSARKSNLAKSYAETFSALLNYIRDKGFEEYQTVMPIHAYTRLRSTLFYSKLAGLSSKEIIECIETGFKGEEILEFLKDTSPVDKYAEINNLSIEETEKIKRIMTLAWQNPRALVETEVK